METNMAQALHAKAPVCGYRGPRPGENLAHCVNAALVFRAHGRSAVRNTRDGTLTLTQRIRLARRHGGLSQAALAGHAGVHRSAVSHWESSKPKRPNIGHLLAIAVATGVQFEWL